MPPAAPLLLRTTWFHMLLLNNMMLASQVLTVAAGCTRMFCEYAKEFVAAMQKVGGEMDHEDQEMAVFESSVTVSRSLERLIEQKCVCHKKSPHCNASVFNLKNRIIFILDY